MTIRMPLAVHMNAADKRERNKQVVCFKFDHLFELAAAGRVEIEKYYTDDVVMELPHLNVRTSGLDNTIAGIQSVPRNDCVDPDKIIYEAEVDAVFRHSGKPYPQRYLNIVQFHDGKICRNVEYMDISLLSGFPSLHSSGGTCGAVMRA